MDDEGVGIRRVVSQVLKQFRSLEIDPRSSEMFDGAAVPYVPFRAVAFSAPSVSGIFGPMAAGCTG